MQWCVSVLILMGQCSFFTCRLYEYHFVNENMTWEGAQKHCRDRYTDLATVYNETDMVDMEGIKNDRDSTKTDGSWIGLHRAWKWSQPAVEYNKTEDNWSDDEPTGEDCVVIQNDKWGDRGCKWKNTFVCYNELGDEIIEVTQDKKNWTEAQAYCREKHTDLISGRSQLDKIHDKTKEYWIGLSKDNRWSDGSTSSFRDGYQVLNEKMDCIAVNKSEWKSHKCDEERPFFCYEDKTILIKLNMTWEEALYFCRDHYDDLVSITNDAEQEYVQNVAKEANSPFVWLGLRYTCTLDFWFWVSDEKVHYKNWDLPETENTCDFSGAMKTEGNHTWVKRLDDAKFNFICSTC